MDHRLAGEQALGNQCVFELVGLELAALDGLFPDAVPERSDQVERRALQLEAAGGQDGHARAEVGDILDNMGRQDDHDVLADAGQKVEEAVAFFGVEAGGRFVDDDQLGIAQQGLGDAETLAHAAGEAGQRLVAHVPEIDLVQQAAHHVIAFGAVGQALEHGEVVEHGIGRDARIDAEVLGQISEAFAQLFRLGNDVDIAEGDAARGRGLERGDAAHQARLAGAVGAKQAEHPGGQVQRHAVQRTHAVAVNMNQIADAQHEAPSSSLAPL